MEDQKHENPLWANLTERLPAIKEFGEIWARSGGIKADRIEHGIMATSFCIASGITPLEFSATYDLVGGVPRKKAQACLADFKQRGGKFKWLSEADDNEKAIGEFTYDGNTYKVKFTIDDARKQDLVRTGSTWAKAPSYMLRARVATTAIGMLAPEIVAGAEAAPDESPVSAPKLTLGQPEDKAKEKEEKELADMGLAPAKGDPKKETPAPVEPGPDPAPAAPKEKATKTKQAKRKSISVPGPGEGDANEDPIEPPPASIEPEAGDDPQGESPGEIGPGNEQPAKPELDPDVVDQLGHIFTGHFLQVALWMIKEKWIPEAQKELQTEAQAAAHLQQALPKIDSTKAMKIIKNKEAFIRAITTAKL